MPRSRKTTGAASVAPDLPALAEQIRVEHEAVEQAPRTALAHAIRAGELLTEAKALVEHGEWLPWLKENFAGTRNTATNYMRLASNEQHVVHLGSVRAALRAITPDHKKRPRPRQKTKLGTKLTEDDRVIAWVAKRMKAGRTRDEIMAESEAGKHRWPVLGKHLGQNATGVAMGIVRDRERRGDTLRPRESGKRLRELHAQKRGGRAESDLWQLQVAVSKAVSTLEYFDLPELDWSEENEELVAEIYDDLERHLRWNEAALDVVTAHMDELGRQRKIKVLEARSKDPSSTVNEREVAARLAEKLKARAAAARLAK